MRQTIAALLAVAAILSADTYWYQDYNAGLAALERGDAVAAIPLLQIASVKHPEPSVRVHTTGEEYVQYLPYFYLGKALYQRGRFQEALGAFAEEERYGEIRRVSTTYQELLDLRAAIASRSPGSTFPVTPDSGASQHDRVQQLLASGYRALVSGKYADAENYFREVLRIDPANPEAKESLRRLKEARMATDTEKAEDRRLAREGVGDFLNGDYDAAIRVLTAATQKGTANPVCRFVLGCAYAATYLISGEQDREALQNAEASFRRLQMESPRFHADESFVSPRILDIYRRAITK